MPEDEDRPHGGKERVAVVTIVFLAIVNAISCGLQLPQLGYLTSSLPDVKEPLVAMGNALHTKQQGSMFSPDPPSATPLGKTKKRSA